MTQTIISTANPKIKKLLALQQRPSERRESGLFVVEGRREVERCIRSGYTVDSVFVCPQICSHFECPGARRFEVSPEIYARIAYRGGTEGVIAEVRCRPHPLEDISLPDCPLVVVMEGIEKPGNLGAVLRSADAAGADAVIVCDPLTDIYNPNLLRASTGTLFSVPIACCTSSEAIAWLKRGGIRILTAQLQDSNLYYDTDMTCGTAIVIGTESTGLSEKWREAADDHIRIPMLGIADSLNASVSAAILLFEAVRQRQ